jgi:hypothetical protein
MTGTNGTGDGGKPACNDRLAINWAGVIALSAMAVGAGLSWASMKAIGEGRVSEGMIILLFGVPNTVVSMIAGFIGGRATATQQINATSANVTGGGQPSAANVETQNVTTQPAVETAAGGVE